MDLHARIDRTFTLVLEESEVRSSSPECLPSSLACPEHHVVHPLQSTGTLEPEIETSVHNCTALNEAVILGQVERVKTLLQAGASLTLEDCTGSTPVLEAAYHNHVEVMKVLLDHGADALTSNKLGLTPLSIASSNFKGMGIVTLLLKNNVDINFRARDGRTALHMAAEGGHKYIVKRLLNTPTLNVKSVCSVYHEKGVYCAPPIFLAASEGHLRVVEMLQRQVKHPPEIVRDAYLLLWAVHTLGLVQGRSMHSCDEFYRCAIKLAGDEDEGSEISELLSVPVYRSVKKIQTNRDFDSLLAVEAEEQKCTRNMLALVILERCLSSCNKFLVKSLTSACTRLCHYNRFEVVQLLLERAFEILPRCELQLISQDVFMLPTHLHVTICLLMDDVWEMVGKMMTGGFSVNFAPFVSSLSVVLDTLIHLKSQQICGELHSKSETFEKEFVHLLVLMACLLETSSGLEPRAHSARQLVQDVFSKYQNYCRQQYTSMLHFFLRKIVLIVSGVRRARHSCRKLDQEVVPLLQLLLDSGIEDIDSPYRQFFCLGDRPLHLAVCWANMDPCYLAIVDLLLTYNAHFDAVNHHGKAPSDLANRPEVISSLSFLVNSPPSLQCISSKVIVSSGMSFTNSSYIPSFMKKFISYHSA